MKLTVTIVIGAILFLLLITQPKIFAQSRGNITSPTPVNITVKSDSISEKTLEESTASGEQEAIEKIVKEDITKPEEPQKKGEILDLFGNRPISRLSPFNFIAFTVQYAVGVGVPANTIILILLLPFLATLISFFRHIIGLPSLDILVPIALSITIVSTGIIAGSILLVTILLASFLGRFILKKIRIMQLPKKALSILIIAVFVFLSLVLSAANGILIVKQLSFFPILILVLLGEKIMSLQLTRSFRETIIITSVTIFLGLLGFIVLDTELFRQAILLFPEIILILIPINIMIGRYFGLRLTEIYRFSYLRDYGNKS